ncbi:DUF4365 domain-containing protein [Parvibaculum sp.]|uniref:DUF4365 domain-containing protein n=1 Tax=Parvibaculum sp. TaxID=2024848 RepID=UPI0034A0276C
MKRIGRSDIIGQRGMAHIEGIVLSMGFMFYPTGGVEAGIDGFIELRDDETGAVGNLLLQVQGKSTERRRLQAETDESFEFPCSEADIGYWMQGTAPVLFIVVLPEKGVAYWKSIKSWFSDPDRLKARKIIFYKKTDLFTKEAKAAVTAVALSTVPGAIAPSARIEEELLVNLVGISFARTLYWAPTSYSTDKSFGAALRELDPKAGSEWIVRGKAVLSFHNLDVWPWNLLCEAEAMEEFGSDEWSGSDDEDRQRDFVALLNRAMSEFVRPALWHDRDSGAYFFRKPKNRDRVRYAYKSLKSFVPRDVVKRYGKRRADPSQPTYWRHSAFLHRFVFLDGDWLIEITPTYHFTRDGYNSNLFSGEYLKKIKEFENNAAVMGQFVMWRHFLVSHGAADLYTDRYPYLAFAPLEPLTLNAGVPDDLWKSQEANPNSPLFDWAQAERAE